MFKRLSVHNKLLNSTYNSNLTKNTSQIYFRKFYNIFRNKTHNSNRLFISNKIIISNYFSFSNKMDTKLNINNKEETLELLKQNGIEFHLQEHEPIPTVQDWFDKVKQDKFKPEQFTFIKNLFLKNKTGGFFLLAANSVIIFI